MPNTSLTERLSRLGRVTELTRLSSGPPEETLPTAEPRRGAVIRTFRAGRAAGAGVSDGRARLRLTAMMIFNALTAELAAAGPTRRASPKP